MSAVPRRLALPNGWWGMAAFVATEGALFGTLLGSYFFLRSKAEAWPPAGIAAPDVALPLVLTGILVSGSIPMQLASSGARSARGGAARLALLLALLLQAGYFGAQLELYARDLETFTPQESAYGSVYYTLLGAHHAHVFLGILLTLWLVVRLLGGLTRYRATAVQAITFYWHFVNALAVAVVLTQISPSL